VTKKAAKRVKKRAPVNIPVTKAAPKPKKAEKKKAAKPAPVVAKRKPPKKAAKNIPNIIRTPELELPPLVAPGVNARSVGRPSLYSEELAEDICCRIAGGESLRSICRDELMPEMRTVLRWRLNNEAFSQQYAQAREIQAESFYDELIDIADDSANDWITIFDKDGNEKRIPNDQLVNRSRLRVDTRKWAMSKILVKRYGTKVEAEVTGKGGGPVVFTLKRVDQE
jgi:hypothetical protein